MKTSRKPLIDFSSRCFALSALRRAKRAIDLHGAPQAQ
jgi:hypothetical protein